MGILIRIQFIRFQIVIGGGDLSPEEIETGSLRIAYSLPSGLMSIDWTTATENDSVSTKWRKEIILKQLSSSTCSLTRKAELSYIFVVIAFSNAGIEGGVSPKYTVDGCMVYVLNTGEYIKTSSILIPIDSNWSRDNFGMWES